jgi:hypothetical protein
MGGRRTEAMGQTEIEDEIKKLQNEIIELLQKARGILIRGEMTDIRNEYVTVEKEYLITGDVRDARTKIQAKKRQIEELEKELKSMEGLSLKREGND